MKLQQLVVLSCLVAVVAATCPGCTVQTEYGPVEGFIDITSRIRARNWRGIPYAAPPVGALRWENPVPPDPWTKPINATVYGAGCPQDCTLPPHGCPLKQSEACLFLNVWAPEVPPTSPLPVMFWIHGGHFEQGSGAGPLYDSTSAANNDVIVVTINYRLGALGFLYTGDDRISGNFGMYDQVFALKWVQNNIAAFGGDPNNVTIFGQSAGGTSVSTLVASEYVTSLNLFNKAIVESNPMGLPVMSKDDGYHLAERLSRDTGCTFLTGVDVACLKGKSAAEIVTAQKKTGKIINLKDLLEIAYPWTPAIDGSFLTDQPLNLWMAKKIPNIPIMMGTVADEGRLFVWEAISKSMGKLEYDAIVTATFGLEHFLKVLDQYPSLDSDNRVQMSELASDYLFTCPTRAAIRAASQVNPAAYLYRFDHAWSFPGWGPNYPFCDGYVCHASELPFVFNVSGTRIYTVTPAEDALGSDMVTAWTNFAKFGMPGVKSWVPYNPSTRVNYRWETPMSFPQNSLKSQQCDFWDALGYKF